VEYLVQKVSGQKNLNVSGFCIAYTNVNQLFCGRFSLHKFAKKKKLHVFGLGHKRKFEDYTLPNSL
jgi:hypothetical protein